eukprot:655366-Pyramimonas_sp.AAC.1
MTVLTQVTKPHFCLLATIALLLVIDLFTLADGQSADSSTEDVHEVKVSPECAAVLITAGGAAGAVTAATVLPMLGAGWCATSGFCAAGVKAGSAAAWWQSTMPLVAAGSTFSTLQSMAMSTGSASTGFIVIGSALGGATGARYLTELCGQIDAYATDPDSVEGQAIYYNLKMVNEGIRAKEAIGEYLADAKEYMEPHVVAAKEYMEPRVRAAAAATKVWLADTWQGFKEGWNEAVREAERRQRERELARLIKERQGRRHAGNEKEL